MPTENEKKNNYRKAIDVNDVCVGDDDDDDGDDDDTAARGVLSFLYVLRDFINGVPQITQLA